MPKLGEAGVTERRLPIGLAFNGVIVIEGTRVMPQDFLTTTCGKAPFERSLVATTKQPHWSVMSVVYVPVASCPSCPACQSCAPEDVALS
jgi:hypothetical protein